jgi:sarcosine oxidase delta subunit
MTKPVVAFAELLRRASQGVASSFWRHCDTCQARRRQVLVAETVRQEIYACEGCGQQRAYTVR